MPFGSTNNIYTSNLTVNVFGTVNTETSPAANVVTANPQTVYYNQATYGLSTAEIFAHRSYAAQSMLQGYLTLCALPNKKTEVNSESNIHFANVLARGGSYFTTQLRNIIAIPPSFALETIDDQILERTWCKFFCEICECIKIIEKTPEIMRTGIGAEFLVPEMREQINNHITQFKKIDAIITAMRSIGQSTESTQTDAVGVRPLPRRLGNTRATRLLRPFTSNTGTTDVQRAKFVARTMADAEVQTTLGATTETETQTAPKKQVNSMTQTVTPPKVLVKSCETQSKEFNYAEKMIQTGVRSSGFSRDIKVQTTSTVFKHKSVETIRTPTVHSTNAGVQTESEKIQLLNQGWDSLQIKVEQFTKAILANSSNNIHQDCWDNPEFLQTDLDFHYSQLFFLFQEKRDQATSEDDKRELWSSFVHHYLPCMEQLRSARSELFTFLVFSPLTEQEKSKRTTIAGVVEVLDMAILLTADNNQWIQDFQWDHGKEKKAILARWQTFVPKAEILETILKQQFRLGKFTYGSTQIPLTNIVPADEANSLNMQELNWVMNDVSALIDIEDFAEHQNQLINDLINKKDVFKNWRSPEIENFLFHIWLPSVATIKLLAQKRRHGNEDAPDKLAHTINVILRDARWGLKNIMSTQLKEQTFANDPLKKGLLEGFKKMAQPESFGLLKDATLVQDLLEIKFSQMHLAFSSEYYKQTSLAFLVACLRTDDFALEAVEEWAIMINDIKAKSREIIASGGTNSSVINTYLDYLKNAKMFYSSRIRQGLSKEADHLEFAGLRKMNNIGIRGNFFGVGKDDKKIIDTLENLAKNLGL